MLYLTDSYKSQLARMRRGCLAKVQGLRTSLSDNLNEVEAKITKYFDEAEQSIATVVKEYSQSVPTALEDDAESDQPKVQKKISNKVKEYIANREVKAMLSNRLQQSISRAEVEEKMIGDLIENPFSMMREFIAKIEKTLGSLSGDAADPQHTEAVCLPLTRWTASLKHPTIDVNGGVVTKTSSCRALEESVCAMSMRTLNPLPATTYRWSFRILKLADRINLGLALETHVKLHGFVHWNWSNIGHGHYLVSSYGRTTSHSNVKVNGKFKAFEYGQGDVLSFAYREGVLTVTKNHDKEFKFEVVAPPEGDPYRAVVYLENAGDSVELLDEK